jgi:hypothetical protein
MAVGSIKKTALLFAVVMAPLVIGAVLPVPAVRPKASPQDAQAPASEDSFQLGLVLKQARQYCARLEKAALDFVCLEEVTEKVDISRDKRQADLVMAPDAVQGSAATSSGGGYAGGHMGGGRPYWSANPNSGDKNDHAYLFDYQFVRREGKVEEKRVLLEKDGKKASPKTPLPGNRPFNFSDVLLAPVQLLDERFFEYYAYRLLGKERVDGAEAWILEVKPRLTAVSMYLGARIWLKTDDASVLRIEWDPSTFGNYETVLARAKSYKAAPELRSASEFGIEKNGLRFPSADVTEEAYRGEDGKLFVRARTSIVYRDHKFFTVETRTEIK